MNTHSLTQTSPRDSLKKKKEKKEEENTQFVEKLKTQKQLKNSPSHLWRENMQSHSRVDNYILLLTLLDLSTE